MATVTVTYDSNDAFARKMIEALKSSAAFIVKKEREETYDPEFVKMIKERASGKKVKLSQEELKELLAV